MQLDASGSHVIDVGLRGCVSIREAAFLFRFAPEHFVVPVRIKWRIYVDEIDTAGGELSQLIEIVAAIDDARVD